MTKTYKHKTLGWKTISKNTNYYLCEDVLCNTIAVPKELIENSSDREEVVEKDWVEELYDHLMCDDDYNDFREIVEKHAPKQKKITEEQFKKVASDNSRGYTSLYMNRLWNLLYDNDLVEDFEY